MKYSDVSVVRSVWNEFAEKMNSPFSSFDFEEYNQLVASLFCPGPYYYYVADFPEGSVQFVSESVESILGINRQLVTLDTILRSVHPDDLAFVAAAERIGFDYADRVLGWKDALHYKLSYSFRSKVADGSYQLFHIQIILLGFAEESGRWKALNIHTNIEGITTLNNRKVCLTNIMNHQDSIELNVDENQLRLHGVLFFSRREREVIELMKLGLTTKEIACRLFIAIDTVKNHRKNILRKAQAKNMAELLMKYVGELQYLHIDSSNR